MFIIIGASGFLGSHTVKTLLEQTDENILAVSRSGECAFSGGRIRCEKCDVRDYTAVKSLAKKYSGADARIIYLAACHNVDYVEQNPKEAATINIDALENFLNSFGSFDTFMFSSSDTVYGEGSTDVLFTEGSPLEPVNIYGAQKAAAEQLVSSAGGVCLRLPFLAGRSLNPARKHFSDTIAETVLGGRSIVLFTDAVRSVLDYSTASSLILKLFEVKEGLPNVINVCGDEALSKYDIGRAFVQCIGVDSRLIVPEQTPDICGKAPRALYAAMDNSLLKSILSISEIHIDYTKI